MDIEEYLRHKKELEAKKELLEAKQRLNEAKQVPVRKDKPAETVVKEPVKPVETKEIPIQSGFHMPLWSVLLIIVIVGSILVYVYYPRVDEEAMREQILKELSSQGITGMAVKDPNAVETVVSEEPDSTNAEPSEDAPDEGAEGNHVEDTEPVEEISTKPGPDFELYVKDPEAGIFDDEGNIGKDRILEVHGAPYYKDYLLGITNKESREILCKIDREITIHDIDNFQNVIDTDINLDYSIEELKAGERYSRKESSPGKTDKGVYAGKGFLDGSYEARCYFCLNKECKEDESSPVGYDPGTETRRKAFFKVVVYGSEETDLTQLTQ